LGLEVLEAANGLEAWELLTRSETRPDIALVDQFMPEVDGWGFLRRVRASERDQALPVVLVSAAPPEPPVGFPDGISFDEATLKPLSAMTLTGILQRHLGLVWEYAEPERADADGAPAGPEELSAMHLPTGCCDLKLAQLNEMLSLAAIIAIEDWAVQMADAYPGYAGLWDEVRRRASAVDLVGLRALAAQLQAASDVGPRKTGHDRPPWAA
jgi:CheY-like chemotaxis protein